MTSEASPPATASPLAVGPAIDGPLELRILSGIHQGARCPARHGALIGAHPDHDIVLADAGLPAQAAKLKLGPAAWDASPDPQDLALASDPTIPYNEPLSLGSIWITVAHPSDPWPALSIPLMAEPGAPEPEHADAPRDSTDTPPHTGPDGPVTTAQALSFPAATTTGRLRRSWAVRASLVVLLLAIAVAGLIAGLLPRTASAPPPAFNPRLAIEQSIGKITAVIEQLGLASRLHVSITPDDVAQVSGWVRNEEERNHLAAALVQIWPMPAMQVSNEAEALSTADQTLKGFGVIYEPRYEGDGRLSVAGVASDPDTRSMAMEAVRAQLPGMTIMGNGILLAPDVANELGRDLAAAGLGSVALIWHRHQLQVNADALDAGQMITVRTILERFNQTHFSVAALAQSDEPYADAVPFKIRSIVSGETPFLVLDNGTKLLVGGTHQHYRLSKIEDHQLIFDGPRPAIVLR